MLRVTLYIAASLDGFIARPDGRIDWLSTVEVPGEDYGYSAFLETTDVILMGRVTYEQVLTFGEWPYADKKTVVFTHGGSPSPRSDVVFTQAPVDAVLADLERSGYQHAWLVGGGKLIQQFWQAGRIDGWQISWIPLLIGEGLPLFPAPGREMRLRCIRAQAFDSGLVQTIYETLSPSDITPERQEAT